MHIEIVPVNPAYCRAAHDPLVVFARRGVVVSGGSASASA
jgi:hypothetical protein